MKKATKACAITLGIALSATGLLSPQLKIASARSVAPAYAEGRENYSVLLLDDSPVHLEKERVTMNVSEYPKFTYADKESFDKYGATLQTEYRFYNPTATAETLHLALPLGTAPDYARVVEYEDGNVRYTNFDSAARTLTVDGAPVTATLHYDILKDYEPVTAARLTAATDAFYTPDLTVKKYVCTASAPLKTVDELSVFADVSLTYHPYRTKIASEKPYSTFQSNGKHYCVRYALQKESDEFVFYVLGEDAEFSATVVSGWYDETEVEGGSAIIRQAGSYTLSEFLASKKPADSVLTDAEWYRCVLREFENNDNYGYVGDSRGSLNDTDLFRWLEYTLTVPANGRVTHTVTAPLYPDIYSNRYTYGYRTASALDWAVYGGLEVNVIATVNHEWYHSYFTFDKTEGGYAWNCDSVPMDDISFTLKNPAVPDDRYSFEDFDDEDNLLLALLIVAGILLVAGVVTAVSITVSRKRKRALQARLDADGTGKEDAQPKE